MFSIQNKLIFCDIPWIDLSRWSARFQVLDRCWLQDDRGNARRHSRGTSHWWASRAWLNHNRTDCYWGLYSVAVGLLRFRRDHLSFACQCEHARNVYPHFRPSIDTFICHIIILFYKSLIKLLYKFYNMLRNIYVVYV